MKRAVCGGIAALFTGGVWSNANAHMPGQSSDSQFSQGEVVEHTLREEKEGNELWERFQAKEVACANLSDEQFGILGEYFMGRMMGDSHAAMNAMMIQAHGRDGEEHIHAVMGKRLSGCDTSASASGISGGWMPMMNMMNVGAGSFSGFGWVSMILWWVLIIAGIVALITWLINQSRGTTHHHEKSPLEILKERYAKGEMNRKEFEERKRDIIS